MTNTASGSQELSPPSLANFTAPDVPIATTLTGTPVPPQQRLYFYSSAEWELFIREMATALDTEYDQIKLLGGSGDQGVDVAGFKTEHGFEGPWDCFQAKHYRDALNLSDVAPEILKLLFHVAMGHYRMPDRYVFLAPKGCGLTLNRLLSKPTELRREFVKKIAADTDLFKAIPVELQAKIDQLVDTTDFALFGSFEILDAIEVHRKTPYFHARFGGPLAPRPSHAEPPPDIGFDESRYVSQLVDVYTEKHPGETFDKDNLASHAKIGAHFRRQRLSFYRAEALRLYARDSVPEGTFEALQDDIHSGVIEIAEAEHATGMDRLSQVLTTSGQLELSSHTLISVANVDDRKGICHQLANEDRLTWTQVGH